jgi:molecular chaperone DnaJ
VLEVDRAVSQSEIATSYRKLAIKYHPDKNPGDEEAIARFKEAADAFEVLSDPELRSRYDRFGHAGVNGQGKAHHFSDVEDIFSAFGDIFGDLFGGRGGRRRARKGRDVRCDVSLTLQEAATGTRKTVQFQRHESCNTCHGSGAAPGSTRETCAYCGGHGQVVQQAGIVRVQTTCPACHGEGHSVSTPCRACRGSGHLLKKVKADVDIPAGVDDGMQVRITGQGEPSATGGPPGDCYCVVSILPHPLFEREGQHLICRMPITYSQAVLGCTLEVPTLNGRSDLVIPRGSQTGDVFRLQQQGMPDPRVTGLGDMLVQVNIEVPKKVTEDEEELLRQLAELEHKNVAPARKNFIEKVKEYFTHHDEPAEPSHANQDHPVS